MASRYYPPLKIESVQAVRSIQRLMVEDAGYLGDPLCPYDADTKTWLRGLMPSENVGDVDGADLETEARGLYRFLKGLQPVVSEDGDNKDALAYARVATSLLDKLLTLVERAGKVKEVKQFEETVISVMEDLLSPEQRTLFMERMAQ